MKNEDESDEHYTARMDAKLRGYFSEFLVIANFIIVLMVGIAVWTHVFALIFP